MQKVWSKGEHFRMYFGGKVRLGAGLRVAWACRLRAPRLRRRRALPDVEAGAGVGCTLWPGHRGAAASCPRCCLLMVWLLSSPVLPFLQAGTKVGGSYYKGTVTELVQSQGRPGEPHYDPWESVVVQWKRRENADPNQESQTQLKVRGAVGLRAPAAWPAEAWRKVGRRRTWARWSGAFACRGGRGGRVRAVRAVHNTGGGWMDDRCVLRCALMPRQVSPWEIEVDPDEAKYREQERRKAEEAKARAERAHKSRRAIQLEELGSDEGYSSEEYSEDSDDSVVRNK